MKYNYKCVVAKNGNKRYYKSVGGKWKRISNAIGMKAEKGKMKYRRSGPIHDSTRPQRIGPRERNLYITYRNNVGGPPGPDPFQIEEAQRLDSIAGDVQRDNYNEEEERNRVNTELHLPGGFCRP